MASPDGPGYYENDWKKLHRKRGADEDERLAVALGVLCCKFVPYPQSKKSLFISLHLI